jgi:hypothetical protein
MSVFEDTWRLDMDAAIIGQIQKLNKKVDKLEASFKETGTAAKKTGTAMKGVAKETKKVGKAGENASKAIEGVAQSMGISAVSGERLANVWLAAGAAAGALLFAVGALATKGLKAYIKSNKDAQDAVERLDKAQERFFETLGKAIFEEEKGITTLDSFAGKLDELAVVVKVNEKAIRGFAEGLVTATDAVVNFYTSGLQVVTFPILGFADLLIAAGGVVLNFGLGIFETIAQMLKAVDVLPDTMKKVIGITDGLQANILASTDITEGFVATLDDQMTAMRGLSDDLAEAAKGTKDFGGATQDAERDLQSFQGPMKTWIDDIKTGTKSVNKLDKALGNLVIRAGKGASAFATLTNEQRAAAAAAEGSLFATEGGFATGRTGFQGLTAERVDPGQQGFKGLLESEDTDEEKAAARAKADATAETEDQLARLDAAFANFAEGGVMLAVSSLGGFVGALAEGNFNAGEFGKGILISLGNMMVNLGEAAVVAGGIGKWFQEGGLFAAPEMGLLLGGAAIVLGSILAGGVKGTQGGGSGARGGDRAAAATRRTVSQQDRSRSDREDRQEAPQDIWLDGGKVGKAVTKRQAQAMRRGAMMPVTEARR